MAYYNYYNNNYNYYKNKNYKKESEEEIKEDNLNNNEINTTCLDCGKETFGGYLFCKNCYQDIKNIRNNFNHNRSEKNLQNHYFELRDKIKSTDDQEDFIENAKLMFALAEELQNIYDNDYLIERVENDLKLLNKQFQNKNKEMKDKKIAEEFNDKDFREKWPREYQCEDGHYVRSLSEQSIDNWLYNNGYLHAYEKSVYMPTQPNAIVLSDFYLPKGNVYIEFWGIEDDEKYAKRKDIKNKLYEENNINKIDLTQQDIKRLNDIMPRLIDKFTRNK